MWWWSKKNRNSSWSLIHKYQRYKEQWAVPVLRMFTSWEVEIPQWRWRSYSALGKILTLLCVLFPGLHLDHWICVCICICISEKFQLAGSFSSTRSGISDTWSDLVRNHKSPLSPSGDSTLNGKYGLRHLWNSKHKTLGQTSTIYVTLCGLHWERTILFQEGATFESY